MSEYENIFALLLILLANFHVVIISKVKTLFRN